MNINSYSIKAHDNGEPAIYRQKFKLLIIYILRGKV